MTDDTSKIDLTRRKALAAMGTIGVASAGAGFGTSAFFSDRETFENNQLTAGTLDMKLAWETHYSDWSEDEAQFAHMPNGDGGQAPTFRLPADGEDAQPIELAVTDGPGFLGATQQSVEHGGVFADNPLCGTDADAPDEQVLIDLGDVKPGDFGGAGFRFELCTNPGYVWLTGGLRGASEGTPALTEPEADDPDERSGVVELLDAMRVAIGVGTTDDLAAPQPSNLLPNTAPIDGALEFVETMSLREFLQRVGTAPGIPLDADPTTDGRDCFDGGSQESPTQYYTSVVWWLPVNHANQVQSDEVRFDLGFYTEQCRHNDGVGLSSGLLAHYPFDVAQGSTVADISGNDRDGTLVNGATLAGGKHGKALSVTGPDDCVEVPDDPGLDDTTPYTETAWVNPSNTSGRNDVTMKDADQWAFGFQVYNGGLRAGFENEDDRNFIGIGGTVPTNTWTHIAVVYDGAHVIGYVDGSEVFDIDQSSDGSGIPVSSATPATNDEPLTIGKGADHYEGLIDDVRIYGRALSAGEIQTLATD